MRQDARRVVEVAPDSYPLVGHIPQFIRDPLGLLSRCAKSSAAVVRIDLDTAAYLLLDANDIKHVLDANHANYDKTPRLTSPRGRALSGNGVLTATGREHLEKRKMLQPAFAASSFMPLAGVVVEESARFLAAWKNHSEIDAAAQMMDLAQQINGRLLFSADYGGADAALADAIRIRRRYMTRVFSSLLPFYEKLPTRLRSQYFNAQRLIESDVRTRIEQRRSEPTRYRDLLARLMHARSTDARTITDDEATDEAITAAITGYETIGEALSWTCLLLTQYPNIAARLREEIDHVLGNRLPTAEDLPKLKYAEMVLNESMRIYPPTWIYVRIARLTDRLPSGVALPAGAKLYICPWAIHRSERYFPDPLRFHPQRFTDDNRKSRQKYAYFPFGGGVRICIGQALAKMQMPLMLATLVQQFNMTLLPQQRISPQPRITLRPSPGIRIRIDRRR